MIKKNSAAGEDSLVTHRSDHGQRRHSRSVVVRIFVHHHLLRAGVVAIARHIPTRHATGILPASEGTNRKRCVERLEASFRRKLESSTNAGPKEWDSVGKQQKARSHTSKKQSRQSIDVREHDITIRGYTVPREIIIVYSRLSGHSSSFDAAKLFE